MFDRIRSAVVGDKVKLFTVASRVDGFCGRDNVLFLWFHYARKKPVAPYEDLIANYDQLDGLDKELAQAYADEFHTAEEVKALRAYLRKVHNLEVAVKQIQIPIEVSVPISAVVPGGGIDDFYMLSAEPGYSLPFTVWGFYDARLCPQSRSRKASSLKQRFTWVWGQASRAVGTSQWQRLLMERGG